jgi:putative FmdB family regulatory protein
MPIYEYACDKCSHEFEAEQRITEDPLKTCPACRSRKVRRLISQTSFVLKGGGWYSDLYSSAKRADKSADKSGDKSGSDKSGPDKDGGGASGGTKPSSDSKSDSGTKPETKSAPAASNDKKGKGSKAAA